MKEQTLAEHCRAFYAERGIHAPLLGTPAGDRAYGLWAAWAFSNLAGDNPKAEAVALAAIEEWEVNIMGICTFQCTHPCIDEGGNVAHRKKAGR
jgi:hypothetical protein